MFEQTKFDGAEAERATLQVREPLLLNTPSRMWIVRRGLIGVYLVTLSGNEMTGQRRHLFDARAGEAIFGLVTETHALLAVPLESTSLDSMSLEDFAHLAVPPMIDVWFDRLGAALAPLPQSDSHAFHEARGLLDPSRGMKDLEEGLRKVHQAFIQCIDRLERDETTDRRRRVLEKRRLDADVMRGALQALAGAIRPQKRAITAAGGTPFVAAMLAVAQALGVDVPDGATGEFIERGSTPLAAFEQVSGIRMRKVLLRGEWWKRDAGPLLGFVAGSNQPVALLPGGKSGYEQFDPVDRSRRRVTAQTAEVISPNAYMPYRPLPDSATTPLALVRFALHGRRRDLTGVLWTGFAAIGAAMFTPLAVALVVDAAIPNGDRSLLWQIAFGLLAVALGRAVFEVVHGLSLVRIELSSTAATSAAVWDRLLKLKSSFFRQYSTGDLQSRAAAIDEMRQKLGATTIQSVVVGLISSLNLLLMLYYSLPLTAVALPLVALVVVVTIGAGFLTLRRLQPLREMEGQTFGLAVQLMNAIPKLRVSGSEKLAFAVWAKRYGRQQALTRELQQIADSVTIFNQVLPTVASAILFAVAAAATREATMSPGVFLAFSAAFGALIGGASALSNSAIDCVSIVNLWDRAKPILRAEPERASVRTHPGMLSGRVAIDRITFRYRRDGPLVLNDLTLAAEPGKFIGIVGPSGSGKTTLFRLLLGFETPESGAVYYDGQDLRGLALHPLRRQLGVVLQQSTILSASIFENISSGAAISLDDAWAAARAAGLAEDIEEMPMGMYTYVSEGATNLAGGQRQRLLIARALALKPKILLFDEATSALDNTKQSIVNESLEKLNVTRLVIAHRLSTIVNADRIYVLDGGRVVQQGTFGTLAQQDGLFARLAARQVV